MGFCVDRYLVHRFPTAVSTIVFSDDSGVQGGKVPALGHLDMVDQGVAALTAAELAPHMEEVREPCLCQ